MVKSIKIKFCGQVVDFPLPKCFWYPTEKEVHAAIHSHYVDDVGHFLDELLDDAAGDGNPLAEFIWSDQLTDVELEEIKKKIY